MSASKVFVVAIAIFGLTVAFAPPGSAATNSGDDDSIGDFDETFEEIELPDSPLTARGGDIDTGLDVTSAGFSPSNCWGQSNNPHKSTSPRTYGDTKGFAKTSCGNIVPKISIKSTVWRKRWWGYQEMGNPGQASISWDSYVGRSGIWNGCQNNRWRTVGNHHAKDIDYRNYYAETMKYADITNC